MPFGALFKPAAKRFRPAPDDRAVHFVVCIEKRADAANAFAFPAAIYR
jgi:hypothetical protein